MRSTTFFFPSAVVALVATASPAQAQSPGAQSPGAQSPGAQAASPFESERVEARERNQTARALFAREDFDGALAEFQRLYELLEGRPAQARVLFNIAQCQERLGRYDEALVGYRRYLDAMGDRADNRDEVQGMLRALESFLGTLRIASTVPGAEVWVDDRRVGTAPGEVRVPGGRHVVQLRAAGHLPSQQEVQLAGRATRELRFTLERIPEQRGLRPVYFWVATGATVAAAGVGAGFGISALLANRDAEARLADPARMFTVTEAMRAATRERALVADALYGTALALGVGAAVLFAFTDFRRAAAAAATPRTALRVSPWSDGRGAGLAVGGSL